MCTNREHRDEGRRPVSAEVFRRMVEGAAYAHYLHRVGSWFYRYRQELDDWQLAQAQLLGELGRRPTQKETIPRAQWLAGERIARQAREDWLQGEKEIAVLYYVA